MSRWLARLSLTSLETLYHILIYLRILTHCCYSQCIESNNLTQDMYLGGWHMGKLYLLHSPKLWNQNKGRLLPQNFVEQQKSFPCVVLDCYWAVFCSIRNLHGFFGFLAVVCMLLFLKGSNEVCLKLTSLPMQNFLCCHVCSLRVLSWKVWTANSQHLADRAAKYFPGTNQCHHVFCFRH